MMQKMRKPEDCVMQTPSAQCFTINHNTITLVSGGDGSWRMVLLDVVIGEGVFSFRTRIHQRKANIGIGVTDRVTQKERNNAQEEHSILFSCYSSKIYYATGDGEYK